MENPILSAAPYLHSGSSVRRIMLDVVLSLTPAVIASLMIFGPRVFLLICVSVAACMAAEYAAGKILRRKNTVGDLSSLVTGLLLAMCVPVSLNPLLLLPGAAVAIFAVKMLFGGIGRNPVNPALTAAALLSFAFRSRMTEWTRAFAYLGNADSVTTATPLAVSSGSAAAAEAPSYLDLFIGLHGGCIGETCSVALMLGGVFLIARKVITPVIPSVFLGTAAVISLIAGRNIPADLLSGGLLLGAVYMAPDYATSPVTSLGKVLYAFGCGLITMLIRILTPLPEGVGIAILTMNLLAPVLEKVTLPRPAGSQTRRRAE